MALLTDPQGLRAIHLYYGFLKWVVVQRPFICADCHRCASAMSFHRWQRVRGLNSFTGLKGALASWLDITLLLRGRELAGRR